MNSVLIATFSTYRTDKRTLTGNLEALLSFFVPRAERVVLIDQPHPTSSDIIPLIEVYQKGKLTKKYQLSTSIYRPLYWILRKRNIKDETKISFKIRDFISVVHVCLSLKEKFSLFVGLESINALAGIFLKRLGLVEMVVYYVSDYSPRRYAQRWFNEIYLWLDRLSCYWSDFIWDVSPAMHPARIKAGLNSQRSATVIRVPNALFPKQIKPLSLDKLIPYSIVYMGTLDIDNGSDLAIEVLSEVLKKFPKTNLHIIGNDNVSFLVRLRNLASSLRVLRHIKFHGFISDPDKLSKSLSQYYLAVAPYRDIPESFRFFGDSTKIRAYLAVGLPVITTYVPPLGGEIEKQGAGMIVRDEAKPLSSAIIKFFSDKKLYEKYRQAAISFAKKNTWENSFGNALKEMERLNAQKN